MKRTANIMRRAFSLIELLLAITLVAIAASIVIPRAGGETFDKFKTETACRGFSNYLKLARSLAITHASVNGKGYEVVLSAMQPYTYSLVNSATSEVIKGPAALPAGVGYSGDITYKFIPRGKLSVSETLQTTFSKGIETHVVSATPIGKITVQL